MLITSEEFQKLKSRNPVPLECKVCHTVYYRAKNDIQSSLSRGRSNDYCSNQCWGTDLNRKVDVICNECGTPFKKCCAEAKKSPHHFCCRSCSTSYRNKHKTFGYRRSKLERYLETQIEASYPELGCLYNDHTLIGFEIDFYFPTLKLAIELNGIFHYEPIYGQNKLDQTQKNDNQKMALCRDVGIEFCVIDTSTCKYLKQSEKDKYWKIVSDLIVSVYKRHS
jgi:very-short-patch-repair endonuclease